MNVLDETQLDRDKELAGYYSIPLEDLTSRPLTDDATGPPLHLGKDLKEKSFNRIYESFRHTNEMDALRIFAKFIVQKRGTLILDAVKKIGDLTDMRVLDFGCGVGTHGLYFAQSGAQQVDFLDVQGPAIKYAKYRVEKRNLSDRSNFLLHDSDLGHERYDVILCVDVMEHLANPVAALVKVMAALKHGGFLLLQVGMKLNPRQGHFAQSRKLWLSSKTRNILGSNLIKLADYYFVKK